MAAYASLVLKTSAPTTPVVSFPDGPVLSADTDFDHINLAIAKASAETDVTQMLIYGYKGSVTKQFTGDDSTTVFTYEADATDVASYTNTTVNGTTSADADGSTLGQVTFTTAPSEGDVIVVHYVKKVTTINDAVWETYSATKVIALDRDTVSTAGSATIYVKLRDDVWNESAVGSATATVDTSIPSVSVGSIVMGDGSYSTTPNNKISEVALRDTITITFQATETIQAWKALVVQNTSDAHNAGTNIVIPTTAGSVVSATGQSIAPATNIVATIKGTDLKTAVTNDGSHIVKLFVQDQAGNWSA